MKMINENTELKILINAELGACHICISMILVG